MARSELNEMFEIDIAKKFMPDKDSLFSNIFADDFMVINKALKY